MSALASIDNPMVTGNKDRVEVSPSAWEAVRRDVDRSMTDVDVAELANDIAGPLLTAIRTADAKLIGDMVLAAWDNTIGRVADRAFEDFDRLPMSEAVAAQVLCKWSENRNLLNRARAAARVRQFDDSRRGGL